jgi:hypothetical protein
LLLDAIFGWCLISRVSRGRSVVERGRRRERASAPLEGMLVLLYREGLAE